MWEYFLQFQGDAKVEIIDAFADNESNFFEALVGGSSDEIADTDNDGENEERAVKLFKVSSNGDDVEVTEVGEKPLRQDMLEQGVS